MKKQGIVSHIGPAKGEYWEVLKDKRNLFFDSSFTVSFSRMKTSQKTLGDTTQITTQEIKKTTQKAAQETSGKTSGKRLGENRLKIISLMKENLKISITEIADKVGISTTSIEKNIG